MTVEMKSSYYQAGGELEGVAKGGFKDSTSGTASGTTYDVVSGEKREAVDPTTIHYLDDGFTLLVDHDNKRIVLEDEEGNQWDISLNDHGVMGLTWSNDRRPGKEVMEFNNNLTIEINEHISLTLVLSEDENVHGLQKFHIYNAQEETLMSYDMAEPFDYFPVHRPDWSSGDKAQAILDGLHGGALIEVEGDLNRESVTFYDENNKEAFPFADADKFDGQFDFAANRNVESQHGAQLISARALEEAFASEGHGYNLDDLALGYLLLLVFQQRQGGAEKLLRVRLGELDTNNLDVNKINVALNEVVGQLNNSTNDADETPVLIDRKAYDGLVEIGVIDPYSQAFEGAIEDQDKSDPNSSVLITGSILKQHLTTKAEQLQNLSQQRQQQIQFSFSNITSASETLTSSLKGFFDMVRSVARNAGG